MNSETYRGNGLPVWSWMMERFHPMDFTVVAALLMAAVFYLNPLTLDSSNFAKYFVSMFLMAMQFRLLDDITDHQIDRNRYPDRVLSRLESVTSLWVFYYCLLFLNTMIIWFIKEGDQAYIYFAIFCVITKIWRKGIRPYVHEYIHSAVKMLKYPIFVFILMPAFMRTSLNHHLIFTLAIVYFAFLVFDYTSTEHAQNNLLANICHIAYGIFLYWGLFTLQTYSHPVAHVFMIVLAIVYFAYFIDFNVKRIVPNGFIILYTMILLVFLELQSSGAIM